MLGKIDLNKLTPHEIRILFTYGISWIDDERLNEFLYIKYLEILKNRKNI